MRLRTAAKSPRVQPGIGMGEWREPTVVNRRYRPEV
jgi:hypothetical protein